MEGIEDQVIGFPCDLCGRQIDWKAVAHHYRQALRNTSGALVLSSRRCSAEHEKRVALANTMADILMDIAYDDDDTNQEYCNVCSSSLIEEDGHQVGCLYVLGLAVLAEAGRSVEVQSMPCDAISARCRHCDRLRPSCDQDPCLGRCMENLGQEGRACKHGTDIDVYCRDCHDEAAEYERTTGQPIIGG